MTERLAATQIGLDLAWREHNPSGAVLMCERNGGYSVEEHVCLGSDDEIVAWLEGRATRGPAIVAIDAPIVAPNPPGTSRACDREVTRKFGRFHAGAFPANRVIARRPTALAQRLIALGWSIDPHAAARGNGRYLIEVFPHAATVGLFKLQQIVKYKHGHVAQRRAGLARFQELLHERLPRLEPMIEPFAREDVLVLRGRGLKHLEDRLDALVCAALVAVYRRDSATCEVLGDVDAGYILVPRLES